jgi:hypothetical protein
MWNYPEISQGNIPKRFFPPLRITDSEMTEDELVESATQLAIITVIPECAGNTIVPVEETFDSFRISISQTVSSFPRLR